MPEVVPKRYRLIYEVEEIRGSCPIYKVGDKAVVEARGFTEAIDLERSDAVCMRLVDNMWMGPGYVHGRDEVVSYMMGGPGECRIACSMPGKPYSPCGYTICRMTREPIDEE